MDRNEPNLLVRRVVSKCIMMQNVIAHQGRIGPGQYLIMSYKTFGYLEKYVKMASYTDNNYSSTFGRMGTKSTPLFKFGNCDVYAFSNISPSGFAILINSLLKKSIKLSFVKCFGIDNVFQLIYFS